MAIWIHRDVETDVGVGTGIGITHRNGHRALAWAVKDLEPKDGHTPNGSGRLPSSIDTHRTPRGEEKSGQVKLGPS